MSDSNPLAPLADPAWLERRRLSLGASEVPAVVGLSPYATALDVFASKLGLSKSQENQATRIGNLLEKPILEEYQRIEGVTLVFPGTIAHPIEKWASCTPDGVVPDTRDVQVKCVGFRMAHKWGAEEEGAEGVPAYVLAQISWEMFVGGWPEADVVALLGTELRRYRVPRDQEFIDLLVEQCRDFWFNHVVADVMPEVSGDRARDIIAARYPKAVRGLLPATPTVQELARQYDAARAAETAAATDKERLAAALCLEIGDREGFEWATGKATWKTDKSGRPNWKAIAQAAGATPELIKAHTSERGRVLRVSVKENA